MFISKKHLPRRTFLKGAGFTLGLPLLDAMIPAATALANTAAVPVKRAGWIYFPHGAIMANTAHGEEMNRWTPTAVGRDFEMSPILESLAPFRDHMTVVSGLGNSPGGTGQVHATHVGTWLTVTRPAATAATNIAPSVDQIAARYIGQETPVPSMELAAVNPSSGSGGPFGSSYSGNLAFPTANSFLRPQSNVNLAFQRIFGAGTSDAVRNSLRNEQNSMLDLMSDSAQRIMRTLGPADAAVLNDYLDQVRELERRAQLLEAKDLSQFGISDPWSNPSQYLAKFDTMFDLIILAFRADMSRIFTYLAANEGSNANNNEESFGVSFPNGGWHATSHHADEMRYLLPLIDIQTRMTERFSRFVAKLAETPDGDGTLLDHSMVLWGSNMSNSHKHDIAPNPTVLMGKGAGAVQGGQHLRYPSGTPLANMWLTMLNRLDVPVESIGNSTGVLAEV